MELVSNALLFFCLLLSMFIDYSIILHKDLGMNLQNGSAAVAHGILAQNKYLHNFGILFNLKK